MLWFKDEKIGIIRTVDVIDAIQNVKAKKFVWCLKEKAITTWVLPQIYQYLSLFMESLLGTTEEAIWIN